MAEPRENEKPQRADGCACGVETEHGPHESVDLMVALRASVDAAKERRLARLSLQEEQPTHLVGAGGWRACDTAADWAGSDTTGVTCAECLATTTDALQEEQE